MLLGFGPHVFDRVFPGGQPGAFRSAGLYAAAGAPVLAPAPGDESANARTSASVAQSLLASSRGLLSAAILFDDIGGVRHELAGTR